MRADDQDKSAPPPPAMKKVADKLFLGPEFLTWLYFALLKEGMELTLPLALAGASKPSDESVRFAVGKRMALKAVDATGTRVALTGPGIDDSGEVLQAIRRGALIDTLSIDAQVESRVYTVVVRAQDGGLSVKLPDLFSEPEDQDAGVVDPLAPKKKARRPKLPLEDVLALRMQCTDEIEQILDTLFTRFITRRLARAWSTQDVAGIRKHVSAGLKDRLV